MNNQHAFDLLTFIWNQRANNNLTLQTVLESSAFTDLESQFPEWKKLLKAEVMKMLRDVSLYAENNPEVDNDRVGYKVQDQMSYNTVYGYQTAFAYFHFHTKGDISEESLHKNVGIYIGCGFFSFAEIPREFDLIMGVSGTLDCLTEEEKQIMKHYNIERLASAPSIYGVSQRAPFTKDDLLILTSRDEWLLKIVQHAQHKVDAGRAVLIFFDDDETLNEFEQTHKNSFKKLRILKEGSIS